MTLRVRPEAAEDIWDAARWYEARQPGLGSSFVEEVSAVFERIETARCATPLRTAPSAAPSFAGFRSQSISVWTIPMPSSSPFCISGAPGAS